MPKRSATFSDRHCRLEGSPIFRQPIERWEADSTRFLLSPLTGGTCHFLQVQVAAKRV